MSLIIPFASEERHMDRILAVNFSLRLFTNDVASGLTEAQVQARVTADFTEATFAGYAAKTLTGGSWTTTQGSGTTPTTGVYASQTFARTSTGAAQNIYGYYVTLSAGGTIEWFEYFGTLEDPDPVSVEFSGDEVRVIPTYTYNDVRDMELGLLA